MVASTRPVDCPVSDALKLESCVNHTSTLWWKRHLIVRLSVAISQQQLVRSSVLLLLLLFLHPKFPSLPLLFLVFLSFVFWFFIYSSCYPFHFHPSTAERRSKREDITFACKLVCVALFWIVANCSLSVLCRSVANSTWTLFPIWKCHTCDPFRICQLIDTRKAKRSHHRLRHTDHVRIPHPNNKQQATTIPKTIRVSWTQEIHSFLVFLSLCVCVCVCARVVDSSFNIGKRLGGCRFWNPRPALFFFFFFLQ